jgi:hypothetical protein
MALDADVSEGRLERYFREGEARARSLGARGPIRFTAEGRLHPEIVEAYERTGLYIFEGLVVSEEVEELKTEFMDLLARAPAEPGSAVDALGRPALGSDCGYPVVFWAEALSDPTGGTDKLSGRAPVKMLEAKAAIPRQTVFSITGPLQFSDAALRVYGHPDLLAAAAAINGPDFVPFQEGFIIKKPGEGCAVAWHQDGTTHWDSPDFDAHTHGLNLFLQLYPSTAANGLWFVPGSHRLGKADLRAWVEKAGGNLLPEAVPLICAPGDVAMTSRQIVHGSFPNLTADWRVTLNMGFHRRRSVVDVGFRRDDGSVRIYDAESVRKRSEVIGYAIDARRRRYPDERSFIYRPHEEAGESYAWTEAARAAIKGYSLMDLRI